VEAWYLAALADGLATHLACRLSSVQLQDLDARLMPDVLQLARSLGQRAVNSCGALLLGRAAAERWSPESRLGRVYAELGRPVFREDAGPGSLAWSPLRFLRLLCREIAPPLPAGQVRLEGFGVRLAGSTAAGDTPALVPGMLTVRLLGEATELAGLRELRARLVQSLRAALFSAVEVAVGDEERGEALAEDESAGRTPPPTSPDAGVVELHGAGKHREALERLLERLPGRHPGWVHATVRDVWRHYARGEVGLDHADRERGRDLWAVVARGVPSDELVAEARLTSAAGGDAVRGASAGLFWAVLLETLDEPGRDRVLEAMVEAVPTGPFACLAIQPPLREQHARLSGETLRRARRAMAAAASCDELGFGERKLARLFLELTRAKGGT